MRYLSVLLIGLINIIFYPAYAENFTPTQQTEIQHIVHDYLINHPEILIEATQALQEKQMQNMLEKAQKVIPHLVPLLLNDPTSPVAGNLKSSVAVIEFFDYQCIHCKKMKKKRC